MRLTIVEVGRPPEPIAADFPRYPAMVEALLAPHLPMLICETVSLVDGDALPSPHEIEAVLITGSPVGVYDPVAWIEPLKAWIVANAAAQVPQVGICFGHQIMAEAFGGYAHKAPQGWGLGRHDYAVVANQAVNQAWATTLPANLSLAVSHQDQVLTAPASARVLASSEFTPHAALIYDHAPALSFQGHPEFCRHFADALIRSRRGTRFPEALADAALESLQSPLDGDLVASWIAGFYRYHLHGTQPRDCAVAA
jgi:GMP synthase-like glutamine amidotransferase